MFWPWGSIFGPLELAPEANAHPALSHCLKFERKLRNHALLDIELHDIASFSTDFGLSYV
jgi:hypothetical protein